MKTLASCLFFSCCNNLRTHLCTFSKYQTYCLTNCATCLKASGEGNSEAMAAVMSCPRLWSCCSWSFQTLSRPAPDLSAFTPDPPSSKKENTPSSLSFLEQYRIVELLHLVWWLIGVLQSLQVQVPTMIKRYTKCKLIHLWVSLMEISHIRTKSSACFLLVGLVHSSFRETFDQLGHFLGSVQQLTWTACLQLSCHKRLKDKYNIDDNNNNN
jgi:hypothetical protein